ncbi:MAG: hypothetical protein HEQ39_00570 [Rhizobacter sp.]
MSQLTFYKVLFFGLPLLALLPSLMLQWRWFFGATVLFGAALSWMVWEVIAELSSPDAGPGEGPASLGFMVYFSATVTVFFASCGVRLIVLLVRYLLVK